MYLQNEQDNQSLKYLLIAISGAAILCLAMGTRQTFGLFLAPVTEALGTGRGAFAMAIAIQNIIWGMTQPFSGMLADKYGSARVLAGGAVLYIVGLLTMGGATSVGSLQLGAGVLVGFGMSAVSFSVVLGAVGRLVAEEKRTLALTLASTGASLGQFLMIPIGQSMIDGFGWSTALFVFAVVILLIFPLGLLLRGKSADIPFEADEVIQSPGQALREAFGHSGYRYLTAGFFVCGFHVVFIATHLPAYLSDKGLSSTLGATALTVIGLANIFGTYFWGMAGGRFSKKNLLSWLYLARAVVLALFLALPKNEITVLTFAGCMGLLWLGTVPLTSGLVAQIFGPRYMSTLFGVVFFSHQVGAFLGVWLGGFVFDSFGSYEAVWVVSIVLSVFATFLHTRIKVLVPARMEMAAENLS